MKTLYVMCGSSGSGKTTFSKRLAREYDALRLSSDELKIMSRLLVPLVEKSFTTNDIVIVDSLVLRVIDRKFLLDIVKNFECHKVLIFMNTPLEECIHRNSLKDNPLSNGIVIDTYYSLQLPTLEEGWDEIIEIKP